MDIVSVSFMLRIEDSQTIVKQLSNSSQTVVRTKKHCVAAIGLPLRRSRMLERESSGLGFSVHKFSYSKGLIETLDPRLISTRGRRYIKDFHSQPEGSFGKFSSGEGANSPRVYSPNSLTLPLSPHNLLQFDYCLTIV